MLRRCSSEGTLKFFVTNFVHVWVLKITEKELLALLHSQNPLLETITTENVWSIVEKHIDSRRQGDGSSCSLHLSVMEDTSLTFKFHSKVLGLAVKMELVMPQQDSTILFSEVTGPLLSVMNVLLARQDHLFSLLEKKDLEISQYKLEGAILSRRNIQTQPFNKNEFLSSHQDCGSYVSEDLCRVVEVFQNLSEQNSTTTNIGEIPKKAAGSSQEVRIPCPNDIPMEPEVNNTTQRPLDVKTDVSKVPKRKRTKLNI